MNGRIATVSQMGRAKAKSVCFVATAPQFRSVSTTTNPAIARVMSPDNESASRFAARSAKWQDDLGSTARARKPFDDWKGREAPSGLDPGDDRLLGLHESGKLRLG